MNIISALLSENSLDIVFENGFKDYFPYIGHRDHCKDSKNRDSRSITREQFYCFVKSSNKGFRF